MFPKTLFKQEIGLINKRTVQSDFRRQIYMHLNTTEYKLHEEEGLANERMKFALSDNGEILVCLIDRDPNVVRIDVKKARVSNKGELYAKKLKSQYDYTGFDEDERRPNRKRLYPSSRYPKTIAFLKNSTRLISISGGNAFNNGVAFYIFDLSTDKIVDSTEPTVGSLDPINYYAATPSQSSTQLISAVEQRERHQSTVLVFDIRNGLKDSVVRLPDKYFDTTDPTGQCSAVIKGIHSMIWNKRYQNRIFTTTYKSGPIPSEQENKPGGSSQVLKSPTKKMLVIDEWDLRSFYKPIYSHVVPLTLEYLHEGGGFASMKQSDDGLNIYVNADEQFINLDTTTGEQKKLKIMNPFQQLISVYTMKTPIWEFEVTHGIQNGKHGNIALVPTRFGLSFIDINQLKEIRLIGGALTFIFDSLVLDHATDTLYASNSGLQLLKFNPKYETKSKLPSKSTYNYSSLFQL